jgi:transcriptional regulator
LLAFIAQQLSPHVYIPTAFRIDDVSLLHRFMQRYSFATLITGGQTPFISHVPLLIEPDSGPRGTLVGHFARTNPHWTLDHASLSSVAVFHGPHAYISPSWYPTKSPAVPTWNYAVCHATGHMRVIEDTQRAEALLDRLVQIYESGFAHPWTNSMPREINDRLVRSIVLFEIPIDSLEGKFKLSQNRAREDQIGAIDGLETQGDADGQLLAAFAREYLNFAKTLP